MKRDDFSVGDEVEVEKSDEIIKGAFLPSSDKKIVSLKLNSGYNISIKKSEIDNIKLIKKNTPLDKKKINLGHKKELPTVTILHTGGTLASKVDYKTGAVSPQFSPEELVNKFPRLKEIANIKSKLISNISSENIRFHHYNLIAKEIEKELKNNVKGIIIAHGTDTLHYTSAALSFILENIKIPVLLVGSQRSSDRPSTDAPQNLLHAVEFICKSNFEGVAICMHSSINDDSSYILPACKARKMHTSRRDAFKVINGEAIAKIDNGIEFLVKNKEVKEKFKFKLIKENLKVGILRTHPHMHAVELENYYKFDALIIEGSGLGHFPIEKVDSKSAENLKIFNSLKKLAKKIPVIMTSQCIFGRVNMNVYSLGRRLIEVGVLNNNSDITTEAAFIKAAWLLSNHKKEFYELWNKNLRGELNERILVDQFLDEKEVI